MFRFCYLCHLRDSISLMTEIRGYRAFNHSVVPSKASESAIMSSETDIRNYVEFTKELTLKAGEVFKCGFEGQKVVETKDVEWDLVTDYDKKIESLLINGLKTKYPDHEFIGEESTSDVKKELVLTDTPTWIIDPIDGTMNFVNSFPYTCISIGLAISKELAAGIIYNPLSEEMYTAIKGQGAFLNDKPICTSNVTEFKKALIEIELSSIRIPSRHRDIPYGRLEAFIHSARGIRSMGSAAMGLAYVAKGALDSFHMDFLKPWDVAAGVLIVREAGGVVLDTKEEHYNFMKPRTIAAANCKLATEIKELIIETDLKTMRKRLTRT